MSGWEGDFSGGGPLLGGLERSDGRYLNQLSASAISTLLTCPEQFRLSYLLLRWRKASAATVLGHAYHHALQKNFEQKVFSGKDMDTKAVLRAYDEGWGQALDEEIVWRNDDPGETKLLGEGMLLTYMAKLAPQVRPIAVEERFERPVPGVPLPLVGRIDVMEEGRILDRKTDKQGVTKARPEWRVQALTYMVAFPKHDFAWHVQSKAGTLRTYSPDRNPGLLLRNTPGTQRTAQLLIKAAWESLSDYYDRYGLEQPWPGVALVHPYACKACNHRSSCIWWSSS